MINGEAVVAQARQGTIPPLWQVWSTKPSYFYTLAVGGLVFLLLAAGATFYYLNNPTHALVSTGTEIDDSNIAFFRTIDFVLFGIIGAIGAVLMIRSLLAIPNAHNQVLVLMPEGFVFGINKPVAYEFATIRQLTATNNRGTIYLNITPQNATKATRVTLDGRFGNAKAIANQILVARSQFAKGATPAMQPSYQPPINR